MISSETSSKSTNRKYDYTLLVALCLLLVTGLVILYSTSAYNGEVKFHDPFYYLKKQGFAAEDIQGGKLTGLSLTIKDYKGLAEELGVGEITLRDIVKELEKPGRDPRDEMPKPILRTDVLDMKDLKEGMVLKGTVRNVIDFGVFVDIGVHQDGLVHISEITDKKFIKHPLEAVSVGDIVDVKVMSVDLKKKRIQLTMKGV